MSVILCGGAVTHRRRILPCPGACDGRRRRVVASYPWSPYYGPTFTCCACGDSWSDGWLHERPFARAWRTKAAEEARRQWREARSGPVHFDADLYVIPDAEVSA